MPVASHPIGCLLDDERFPRGWPSVLVSRRGPHVTAALRDDRRARGRHAGSLPEPMRHGSSSPAGPRTGWRPSWRRSTGLDATELEARLRAAWEAARVTANVLLVHGDDGFGVDRALLAFAERIGAADRTEIIAERPRRTRPPSIGPRSSRRRWAYSVPGWPSCASRSVRSGASGAALDRLRRHRRATSRTAPRWRWPRARVARRREAAGRAHAARRRRHGTGRIGGRTRWRRGAASSRPGSAPTPQSLGAEVEPRSREAARRADRRRRLGDRCRARRADADGRRGAAQAGRPTPATGRSRSAMSRR